MTKPWIVPSQLLPQLFSQLTLFNKIPSSGSSTAKYEQLFQPTGLGVGIESCEEDGLDENQRPRNKSYRSKFMSTFALPMACVIIAIILLGRYLLSDRNSSHLIHEGIVSPLRVYYKSHIADSVDCDPPVQIVKNQDDAHVVIWPNPAENISAFDGEKARREKPWQLNAFWSLENEEYYEDVKVARQKLEAGDPKAFDLAISYKKSSDFPIPYIYSFIDLRKQSLPFQERRQDKLVAAFISNCSPKNNRTEVLDELMKLLPGQVDSFGDCLNNADPDKVINQFNWNPSNGKQPAKPLEGWNQKMRIISRYKFTVAFENADEQDYVTEKYYQALSAGSIPIQLGQTPEDFKKFKPSPNCALNVADFKTVKELANRIKEIANDRNTFESMLDWKTKPYPQDFENLVSWGKIHETCRLAKWVQNEWQNPFAVKPERYEALRQRIKSPHNSTHNQHTNSSLISTF